MNALLQSAPGHWYRPMRTTDIDAVMAIETAAYGHPWTRGNFIDSLAAGYLAELRLDGRGQPVGYYVALPGFEETHLLNLTVAPAWQRAGHGSAMLRRLQAWSTRRRDLALWLEVRRSNGGARALYRCFGFVEVGYRRDYYPADHQQREDALVLRLDLDQAAADDGALARDAAAVGAPSPATSTARSAAPAAPHAVASMPVPSTRPPAAAPAERPAAPASKRPAPSPAAGAAAETPAVYAGTPNVDAATLDWPALRAAVEGCRACALCETRRQTVFGVGHERAHLMIVGEAPGEQEDLSGEPFVGAAGQLLDRMLQALGLTRAERDATRQVFIANTLKCRPPRNRNPTPAELAACQPFLERQVALVQPRMILAMGRFAVQSLLASDAPIGRLRGQVHAWRGVPLVVTYHPAYLLRQPADKARAWDDLCLAAEILDRPAL